MRIIIFFFGFSLFLFDFEHREFRILYLKIRVFIGRIKGKEDA